MFLVESSPPGCLLLFLSQQNRDLFVIKGIKLGELCMVVHTFNPVLERQLITQTALFKFMNDLLLGMAGLNANEHRGNCQLHYASDQ